MEDDLVCEYDSTWDTESDGDDLGENTTRRSSQDKTKKPRAGFWSNPSSRNLRAARDMQNYRHGYPNMNEEECPEERMTNLKFYLNEITSSPDEVSIEAFHKEWKTDYKRLERVHSYIQWLFPLREPGVNYMATELTKKEIQAFRESEEAKRRLVDSYKLMLGFYGMQLLNRDTGEVKRAENWRERYANLERNMHNNLRITRILKSLGELGFEHYQAPLVRFFLEETLVKKTLSSMKRSVLDYFLFAVRDKRERKKLICYAFQHFEPKDKFVWCPRKIQKRLKKKSEKRQESAAGNQEGAATDEGRSRGKAKDGEAGSGQKEGRAADDVTETQKQTEEDTPMSMDTERQSEGSSVDPEPTPEGSSVDPLPLDTGNSTDNSEMDHSNCAESSLEKSEDGKEDELKDGSQLEAANESKKVSVMQEPIASESDLEKPLKKKRDGDMATTSNGVAVELAICPDENKSMSLPADNSTNQGQSRLQGSSTVTGNERTMTESPKHLLPSLSSDERAEKHPRTDFSNESGATDSKEITAEMTNARPAERRENTEAQHDNQTNGMDSKNKDEPMDTESAPSTDLVI